MKHTPTPWEVKHSKDCDADIIDANKKYVFDYSGQEHDDILQNIVKCVNMHDELVNLLERSLTAYEIPNDFYLTDKTYEVEVRELLKKAKED